MSESVLQRNKNNSRQNVLIQHLGDQYCCVTSMYNIIAFYATAKQALILLLIWLDLGFISSGQMRPSGGSFFLFLIMACQSDSKLHIAGRRIRQRRYRGKSSNISLEFTEFLVNRLLHVERYECTSINTLKGAQKCRWIMKHIFTQITR